LRDLHWLTTPRGNQFRLSMFTTYGCLHSSAPAPSYLTETLHLTSSVESRRLISSRINMNTTCAHRRRSGWTSGGTHGERRRWVRAEWGGIWGGVSLSSRLRDLGSVVSSPAGSGPGQSPGRKLFLVWCILKATERSFLYLYDKIWGDNLH